MHWLLTLFSTKEENMKFIFSGAPDMQEALKNDEREHQKV